MNNQGPRLILFMDNGTPRIYLKIQMNDHAFCPGLDAFPSIEYQTIRLISFYGN